MFALCVAATMGQIASAYPTAGGLYHWASILGGRGWGWVTAWFNLAGLVAMLAAINVGTYQFTMGAFAPMPRRRRGCSSSSWRSSRRRMPAINHVGIRVTRVLTDFSGYLILVVAAALTIAMLAASSTSAHGIHVELLWTFTNYSNLPADNPVWPAQGSIAWLFLLGMLLPAYTLTGFDASAHVSEETTHAAVSVPRGIVNSVVVATLFGWIMLSAVVVTIGDPAAAANKGTGAFVFAMSDVLPHWLCLVLWGAIAVAQYLCGLATVTSASRMAFAFARDGGLPFSHAVRHVSLRFRTPPLAIWLVSTAAVLFTVYADAYNTIAAASVVLLYISYVLPTALGLLAFGRSWTEMGPWQLGRFFRPLAVLSIVGCLLLSVICMWPPNEKVVYVVTGMAATLAIVWFTVVRHIFPGPPHGVLSKARVHAIAAAEAAAREGEEELVS